MAKADREPAAFWVATSELLPWVDNPRVKDDAHITQIVNSIKAVAKAAVGHDADGAELEQGFGAPIVARVADREIIAGHTRLYAAQRLGMKRVPVRFMDLPADAAHRLARADNRLAETGSWDLEKLIAQLQSDAKLDQELVRMQGWDSNDLERLTGEFQVSTVELPESHVNTEGARSFSFVLSAKQGRRLDRALNRARATIADGTRNPTGEALALIVERYLVER